MLLLQRKPGESVMVGEDVEVRVTRIADGKVELGFTAPKDVQILRSELLDRDLKKELAKP